MFTKFKNEFLKFVKKIRDFLIFHCFKCNLDLYLRSVFMCNKSLQTVYVGVSMKYVKLSLLLFYYLIKQQTDL